VGYDHHLSRATFWIHGRYYPIGVDEVVELVHRSPDLTFEGLSGKFGPQGSTGYLHFLWTRDDDEPWMLRHYAGQISVKHAPQPLLRRMEEFGAEFDAWLMGDDGELLSWDGQQMVERQREREYFLNDPGSVSDPGWITRGRAMDNDGRPITQQEWFALAERHDDLRIDTAIAARLPSGPARIPCPPTVFWIAHPSREPVPMFHDDGMIEVWHVDSAIATRTIPIATELHARFLDFDNHPVPHGGIIGQDAARTNT